jgi:hypothetical protein
MASAADSATSQHGSDPLLARQAGRVSRMLRREAVMRGAAASAGAGERHR